MRAIAATFLTLKLTQFGAVWQVGLLDRGRWLTAVLASAIGPGLFALGLRAQDGVPQATFNRAVLALLTVVSLAMVARGLRG